MGGDPQRGEPETVSERPHGRRARDPAHATLTIAEDAVTGTTSAGSTTVTSPLEAMREEEAHQARVIIRLGRVLGIGVVAALPVMDGSVGLRVAFAMATGVAIIIGFWLERVFRDPMRYSERMLVPLIVPVWFAVYAAVGHLGVLSALSIFPVLCVYYFCRRQSGAWSLAITGIAIVTHDSMWAVVSLGIVDDPGLLRTADLSLVTQIVGFAGVHAGYVGAFLLGRSSHEASLAAIEKLQRATQLAAQREALLHEARQDLQNALQLGGTGRFSGRTFGSYQLGVVIGRGGMGEVYEATHVDTGELAAAKLLHARTLDDPRHIARFLREVRTVSGLRSPHIARVLAACEPTDEVPYFIMERLQGEDLAHLLRSPHRLTDEGIEKLLRQVGALLDVAREQGVVHRDLKPSNLFLAEQGEREPIWKVLDFGVAALSGSSGTLTQGHVVGTPAYMAPEQARGDTVDHRTDLYALTAIAYRWLTGRPAFSGREVPALLYQVVHTMPTRPSAVAELHPHVDAALAIGLAKRADQRFDRAGQLADAVRAALAGSLDAETLARGAALQAAFPWGATQPS